MLFSPSLVVSMKTIEEIRKEVDELAKQAYDVTKLRTIADILLLDGNGLFSKK